VFHASANGAAFGLLFTGILSISRGPLEVGAGILGAGYGLFDKAVNQYISFSLRNA